MCVCVVRMHGGWGWVTSSSWQPGFQNALIFPARVSAPDVSSCPQALARCPTPSGSSECLLSESSQTGRGVPRHFRPLGSDRQELLLSKHETGSREMSLPFCSGSMVTHQNLCKTSDHSFERKVRVQGTFHWTILRTWPGILSITRAVLDYRPLLP